MKVIPFIVNIAPYFPEGFENCGVANGYVAIPPTNKYYGLPYYNPEVESLSVHGGITFAEFVTNGKTTCSGQREFKPDYVGKRNAILDRKELLFLEDKQQEIPDDWFILGFDTMHWGDNKENWNEERVKQETLDLAKQLEKGE